MKTDYLRVSVTDRCNLRCVYCHPLGGCNLIDRKEILKLEEIHRIVELFSYCGIRKVRLTGGEPLIRRNIVYLIEKLSGIEGIEELSITTNGVLLASLAQELKDAGLQRVNISVDSIDRKSYKEITGFDLLPKVTKGIYKALEVGLKPVKINSVIIKGINVSQILPLAEMSIHLPVAVRFIEYCPTSQYTKPASDYMPNHELRKVIEREFGPVSIVFTGAANGPASYFKIRNAVGTIGFINGRSSMFCHDCNRLRLTSDGKIKPCLYSSQYHDIKKLIRDNADDEHILRLLEKILYEKNKYTKLSSSASEFDMQKVGG
ncbi:MAG TPA: GTP 3',8-cyclase MoaA [Phycisphaerales bacterium]|nr:GTP 3',8-cyclase MoaA [Phycisphaerales bacterium]